VPPQLGAAGDATGIFVIPSNSLNSTPAFVTSSPNSSILNFGYAITVSGTSGSYKVTGYTPATFMYAATDTNNNLHVYALNLASSTRRSRPK